MTCWPRPIAHSITARSCARNSNRSEDEFKDAEIEVPTNLKEQVRAVLDEHDDLRWDDAVQIVLDKTQLDRVRTEKQKAKKKSGDFTDADEDERDNGEGVP